MTTIVTLLGVVLVVMAGMKLFVSANPAAIARNLPWILGAVALVGTLGLVLSGRGGFAIGLLLLFWPLAQRWWTDRQASRQRAAFTAARRSDVVTDWLAMQLDHGDGAMFGRVLKGPFAGRSLGELTLEELRGLWRLLAADDPESAQLLAAWADRAHGDAWRPPADSGPAAPPSADGRMSRAEALTVLGLTDAADATAIKEAHHRLMKSAHPDAGGSAWLAAKINQARDVLLG